MPKWTFFFLIQKSPLQLHFEHFPLLAWPCPIMVQQDLSFSSKPIIIHPKISRDNWEEATRLGWISFPRHHFCLSLPVSSGSLLPIMLSNNVDTSCRFPQRSQHRPEQLDARGSTLGTQGTMKGPGWPRPGIELGTSDLSRCPKIPGPGCPSIWHLVTVFIPLRLTSSPLHITLPLDGQGRLRGYTQRFSPVHPLSQFQQLHCSPERLVICRVKGETRSLSAAGGLLFHPASRTATRTNVPKAFSKWKEKGKKKA